MSKEENPIIGVYQVCGTISKGIAGAPTFHFKLLVHPATGQVTGLGNITQAVAAPHNNLPVHITHGVIHATGIPPYTHIVALQGTVSNPPSGLISPFTAHMAINNGWDGIGGFEYLGHKIEDAKVTKVDCGK